MSPLVVLVGWIAASGTPATKRYELANNTAAHSERGVPVEELPGGIPKLFKEFPIAIEELAIEEHYKEIYETSGDGRIALRNHLTNQKQEL